ncbi:MAG: polysaccharide biosynthesis tyrosine autokinase [Nitrospirae bacterium]|nr:polysaccharide biosynthesis tyrosine autokinase [Nitrospirota bacterium]
MFEDKEIHLRDYLHVVLKHRYKSMQFFAIIFAVTLLVTFSTTPVYVATTKVLIEKSEPANLSLNPYAMMYDPDFSETQFQLIKSFSVAQRVVRMLGLGQRANIAADSGAGTNIITGTFNWFRDLISTVLHVGGAKPVAETPATTPAETAEEDPLRLYQQARMISGSIQVSPIKNSKIVNISFASADPKMAALIVNTVARAYTDEVLDIKMGSSQYALKWLTEKADEERARLNKTEKELQEYMRDKDIATLENKVTMVPERMSEIAIKLAQSETKRKELETLYSAVKAYAVNPEGADEIPAIAADPVMQSLRSQILKAEQTVAELSQKYGQRHPAMVTAAGDLNVLRDRKREQVKRVVATIKNEYEIARSGEENLRRLAGQAKAETLSLGEKFVQYGVLKREAETSRELFGAIVKRIKEQGITQDIKTVTVWVIEKAEAPASPAKPNKFRNILLGLVIGLMGGVGLAFFIEYLDNTVKSAEDIEQRFDVPVFGTIELLDEEKGPAEDIVLREPHANITENYRAIRTSIMLSTADQPPKHILVTSIAPQEGKTTTAVNLAAILAQSGHNVLLIDADLRRPRIRRVFGIETDSGLSTYLAGTSAIEFFVPKGVEHLQVVPSGPVPPNPAELIGSRHLQDLVASLEEKFDFIVWDSPPLFAAAESLVLSKMLSGTLLVSRAGKTTYKEVERGIKSLRDIEARVLGIVVNGLNIKENMRYNYRYYGYYGAQDHEQSGKLPHEP